MTDKVTKHIYHQLQDLLQHGMVREKDWKEGEVLEVRFKRGDSLSWSIPQSLLDQYQVEVVLKRPQEVAEVTFGDYKAATQQYWLKCPRCGIRTPHTVLASIDIEHHARCWMDSHCVPASNELCRHKHPR